MRKGNILMSKKTGRLTKVERFYIEHNPDLDSSDLARDLNRTKSFVEKYRTKNPVKKKEHITTTNHYPKADTVKQLFARQEKQGVTVMTPEASEATDKIKQKELNKNSIHVIKED